MEHQLSVKRNGKNKKNANASVFSLCFLLFIVLSFTFIYIPIREASAINGIIVMQFIAIGAHSIVFLMEQCKRRPYSLATMHSLFILFFMFFAGVTKFAYNEYNWNLIPTISEIIMANNIILIWLIAFTAGYGFFIHFHKDKQHNPILKKTDNYKFSAFCLNIHCIFLRHSYF